MQCQWTMTEERDSFQDGEIVSILVHGDGENALRDPWNNNSNDASHGDITVRTKSNSQSKLNLVVGRSRTIPKSKCNSLL